MTPGRVLLVFLDGVGIGEADPDVNPFARAWAGALVPTLHMLTGGRLPTLDAPTAAGQRTHAFPLDASLSVPGTPQSGTGQAALLTGESAAEIHGSHFGPWTPVSLRPLVEECSVLRRARDAGKRVAFANAYPRGWPGPRGGRRIAGPPLAARGAGVLDRHEEALASGDAVSSEIVNDGWKRYLGHGQLAGVTPEQAGANLARVSSSNDLTLYAHYSTDTVGHRGDMDAAVDALVVVDRFLGGVVDAMSANTLLLVASDHGNIEDVRGGHTTNPALGLAVGPGAERAAVLRDLREVAGFVLGEVGGGLPAT